MSATSSTVDVAGVFVPDEVECLRPWVAAGVLGRAEVHMAAWTARAAMVSDPAVLLGAAMAVWAAANGHTCVELSRIAEIAEQQHARAVLERADDGSEVDGDAPDALAWPSPVAWRDALAAAGAAVRVVEAIDPDGLLTPEPFVLFGDRLYLQRYWVDECVVASDLRRRAHGAAEPLSTSAASVLDQILPVLDPGGQANRQRAAAEAALAHRVSLVVGGPGTGKTFSVARMLAALVVQAQQQGTVLRIALAAPTGKAAARMKESIAAAVRRPDMLEHVPEAVRTEIDAVVPSTIHRLLGSLGVQRQRFRHDRSNPLPHDVVVIDEMSMVSLPLLARLCEAVRPDARLVLIGDPDQLESVELGAVLADLVAASGVDAVATSSTSGPLAGHAVRLLRAHRFEEDSPIGLLADAVRTQDVELTLDRLQHQPGSAERGSVRFLAADDVRGAPAVEAVRAVVQPVLRRAHAAAAVGDAEAALAAMAEVRLLCAHRRGPHGVADWNAAAERWMHDDKAPGQIWYVGRAVLVTRNDARLGLANGDTGIVVAAGHSSRVAFQRGKDVVTFDPVQLSDVETAFAMTVHKSQGSEYTTVVLVLPPHDSPLVGRELLYTGITRARDHLLVVGGEESVRRSVLTSARRMTGLADALR